MTARKILVVIGSRPETIKLAPVVRALRRQPEAFDVVVCSTGQQEDMIPPAMAGFGLDAEVRLRVMKRGQSLSALAARALTELDRVIGIRRPDLIMVQGDTTSAMTAAMAGFHARIPVAHVEAGMRTWDLGSPYPEEMNRRTITLCSSLHFAPTSVCADNLLREGVTGSAVFVTGNTVVDALLWARETLSSSASTLPGPLDDGLRDRRTILVTSHRRESFGAALEEICLSLRELCSRFDDIVCVLPVHPNPNVRRVILNTLSGEPRVILIDPQPYRSFVELMDRSYIIITDSGGIQEEAPSLDKPVLVVREVTERPEGIEAGCARLIGTSTERIVDEASRLLQSEEAYGEMAMVPNPYGDGRAAERIAALLGNPADWVPYPEVPDVSPPAGVSIAVATSSGEGIRRP